ncbi:hypothetical protein FRC17_005618, partial [Serendipita sp. 399]
KEENIGEGHGGKSKHSSGLRKETQDDTGEKSLWSTIEQITGIGIDDLLNFEPGLYDIGKRMTWASNRKTTRTEDMAYCLIGIFDVNLSIAYGEKEKAFYRLQVEILQNSDDKTLFDWQGGASKYNSMLAASPACFSTRLDLHTLEVPVAGGDPAFTLTSVGIRASLVVHQMDQYAVPESWKRQGATAFSILGTSSNRRHIIMILGKIGKAHSQYKRLELIADGLSNLSLEEGAFEI